MSISTYDELQTAVARWIHRDSLTDYIPDFIALGEAKIYRELRVRAMEAALNETIASGVIAVPASYVELKHAYIVGSTAQGLSRKGEDWIYSNYPTRSSGGTPKFIAREVDSFIFGPYPDSAYVVKGTYYRRLDALSDANPTNWFTTNAPDILLWAALCEAAPYCANDVRIPIWEGKYATVRDQLQAEDKREAFSGSTLTMTAR